MQTLRQCDLSVIVPVYNLERFLKPLLWSLKEQKHDYNVEHIFIMNNCTDHSEEIIRNSGLDCRILYCPIQGCGPARNVGMDEAHGEYVWFMDGDDMLLSGAAIKDALDKAKAEDLNILYIPFKSDGFLRDYFSMVWQYVMKREYIDEFRFPFIQPCEDDAFMDAVLAKAGYNRANYLQLPRLEKPMYFYRYLREGSNMYRTIVLQERI